jgi:hypothetical protein
VCDGFLTQNLGFCRANLENLRIPQILAVTLRR